MPSTSLEFDETLRCNHDHDCCGYGREETCVKIAATADLPSKFGQFQCEGAMREVGEREPSAEKNRISYARPELGTEEWYLNGPLGVGSAHRC